MHALVRLSPDITTKSDRTRRRFMRRLVDNLRDAFRSSGIVARVDPGWVRLTFESDDPRAAAVAARVFGVHSLSCVEPRDASSLETLVEHAATWFRPQVAGKTFAVRAKTGGSAPFDSRAICIALGDRLRHHGTVRLDDPEITCHVEVREGTGYLFSDSLPGQRGLPLGCEGRAVALISGGFDSAVAAWMVMRRGVALDYVFCRLGGAVHTQGALRVLQVLTSQWGYGSPATVHVLPFEDVVERIRARCHPAMWQLALKRAMYRAAQQAGRTLRAQAIITGESIGQVSSQTLKNLRALDGRLELPVLRPLIGMDKEEIIARARHIGTFDLSATVQEYCDIVPKKPAVAAKPSDIAEAEAALALDVEALIASGHRLDARALGEQDWSLESLEIDTIPEGAAVLDLRGVHGFAAWHYPGAARLDLAQALAQIGNLDKARPYVAYCEFGLKSAFLAESMRKSGYEAYNFHGGLRGVMRYASVRNLLPLELMPEDSWR